MQIAFHDETGALAGSVEYLRALTGPVAAAFERVRGRTAAHTTPVVLESHAAHESRFPPAAGELADLEEGAPLFEPSGTIGLDTWSTATLGVTTICAPELRLPAEIALNSVAVLVDVEGIQQTAGDLGVDELALLGVTFIHELAHVNHGHAAKQGGASHGWYAEGEAQRDTVAVLRELVNHERYSTIAVEMLRAMVALAAYQPPAYQHFDTSSAERNGLLALDRQSRIFMARSAARSFAHLSEVDLVEEPFSAPVPRIGDEVYLVDGELVAGPYRVVALPELPRLRRKKQADAAAAMGKPTWALMKPMSHTGVGKAGIWASHAGCKRISGLDVAALKLATGVECARLLDAQRQRAQDEHERSVDEFVQDLERAGASQESIRDLRRDAVFSSESC